MSLEVLKDSEPNVITGTGVSMLLIASSFHMST